MKRMKLVAVALFLLLPASALAISTVVDTTDIYGGPGTLEGKFQTAAGEPDEQGWIGVDDTDPPPSEYWNISTRNAANLDWSLPDNHAWWCGADFPACVPTDSAWGYGNDWNEGLGTSRTIDPSIGTQAELTGLLNIGLEPGYDFLHVEALTAAGPVTLLEVDGIHAGYELVAIHTWQPGDYIGEAENEIQFRLVVISDTAWSDADCSFYSAGAVQADNLMTELVQPGGPAYPALVETCEPGDPSTWGPVDVGGGVGDFAQLWTDLDDMDPDQDNHSPQWAFINDGEIVPELDPSYCWDKCYGPDSLSAYYGSEVLENSIVSPPIEMPEAWEGTPLLAFDGYLDPAECYPIWLACGMHSTSDPAGETGWELNWFDFLLYGESPAYKRFELALDEEIVPPDARYVRIKIQAHALLLGCWGPMDSPAPYLDNVRLQLAAPHASDVPVPAAFTCSVAPNPFNPRVAIRWDLPRADDLSIRIHDARGRVVRDLRQGPAAAGPGRIVWQGRDDNDRPLAAGVYFCSLESSTESQMLKLTLLK